VDTDYRKRIAINFGKPFLASDKKTDEAVKYFYSVQTALLKEINEKLVEKK